MGRKCRLLVVGIRESWRILALVVVLATLSCQPAVGPPTVLRIAYQHPMVTLDPHGHDDSMTGHLLSAVYETLVSLSPGRGVEPALARDWTTPDDTTWRLRLRPGVLFHDGSPVTVDDVIYSIERVRGDERSAVISNLEAVTEVKRVADADDAIEVRTAAPVPLLLGRLANLAIVPQGFDPATPIGTGPYRWRGQVGEEFVLEGWPQYWGDPAPIQEVRVRFVSSEELAARPELLEVLDCVPRASSRFLSANLPREGWRVARTRSVSTLILGMDIGNSPLDDPRVRQAIDLAFDRRAVLQEVDEQRFANLAVSMVPAEVFGYVAPNEISRSNHGAARRLIESAGVAGSRVTLRHAGIYDGVALHLATLLGGIGLEVDLREMAYDEFYRSVETDEPGLFLFAWSFRFADASDFLESLVHSRDEAGLLGRLNASGYSDPRVDRLIEQAMHEPNSAARLLLLRAAIEQVAADRPYIPLVHPVRTALIRDPFRIGRSWGPWPRPQDIGAG